MCTKTLNLLNFLPLESRPHTAHEVQWSSFLNEPLRELVAYGDELELVKAVLEGEGLGDAATTFQQALDSSVIYKEWQKSMPFLKDVQNIKAYKKSFTQYRRLDAVNNEIIKSGGYLQQGQILYRGGVFQMCDHLVERPMSSSMVPPVARWHAIKNNGALAILRINQAEKIKAYVYKRSGNQSHKVECEVLLQGGLILKFKNSFEHFGTKIAEFDVFLN